MSIAIVLNRVTLRDTAVYWGVPSSVADGTVSYDEPTEIDCLWREDLRRIKDFFEKEIMSRAHIYTTIDLVERGMLYHGKLEDLVPSETADPSTISNAYEIRRFEKTPSLGLKNKFIRKSYV